MAIRDVKQQNQQEIAMLTKEHAQARDHIKKNHQSQLKETKKSNDYEIADMKTQSQIKISQEHERREKVLEELKKELEKTQERTEKEKSQIKQQQKDQLSELNENFENSYEDRNFKTHLELDSQNEKLDIALRKNDYNTDSTKKMIEQKKLKEIKQLESQSQDQVDKIHHRHQLIKNDTLKNNNNELNNINQQYRQDYLRFKDAQDQKINNIQAEGNFQFQKIQQFNRQTIEEENKEFALRLANAQNQKKDEISGLEKKSHLLSNQLKNEFALKSRDIIEKSRDEFYQTKQIPFDLEDLGDQYQIKIQASPHEKEFYNLSGEQRALKLTFNRRHQDRIEQQPGWTTKNERSESSTQIFSVNDIIDTKKISKSFKDGVLTFLIKKA